MRQYVVRGYEPESSWPYWLVLAAALGIATVLSLGCYATMGPVASCADDPSQSWCLGAKKQPRTCYQVTMGCTALEWGPLDANGNRSVKCVASPAGVPQQIPCDSVPKPDGGLTP